MVRKIKAEVPAPVILLGTKTNLVYNIFYFVQTAVLLIAGNKGDLEDFRQVCVTAGAKTATQFACLFSELSAAESAQQVIEAFESLIREAQLHQYYHPKIFARCKRPNIITMTKLIIALFGKSPKVKRRRPFLSL
ncbi:hypothetical protein RvY_09288-3 [Ramazzottius varieornatus]|uniref:small monomeric GTPase n=1 Tax=Ramazzottius varieornatus TaxID=947166 RepID=A0A1D1V8S7_RAMVA|nr:hypothetical protein RvY_09288-3 [Ramazzottius varieornatus]